MDVRIAPPVTLHRRNVNDVRAVGRSPFTLRFIQRQRLRACEAASELFDGCNCKQSHHRERNDRNWWSKSPFLLLLCYWCPALPHLPLPVVTLLHSGSLDDVIATIFMPLGGARKAINMYNCISIMTFLVSEVNTME